MIKRIAIVIIGIIVVVLGRGFFFYSGFNSAPPASEMPSYEQINVVPLPPSTEFTDNYTQGEGTILIDLAHDNAFTVEELSVLISRLISRGLTIEFLREGDDLKKELSGEEKEGDEEEKEEKPLDEEKEGDQEEKPLDEEKEGDQEEKPLDEEKEGDEEEEEEELPPLAFIIVSPQNEFSKEDRETIDEFVDNGGRLLLIADPTRHSKINSLSLKFGLMFESDYLYNQKENDANFTNIFVSEFKENEVTKNLEKIALYAVGSITSDNASTALVDENTFSSLIETRKKLSPIALANESKVLAVHDLTFMTEPYNGVLGNNRLISNIADWLATPTEEEVEEAPEEREETPEGE
ncbi:hypothetical protein ACFLV4_01620 [Chloroflexota bacterium]